MYDAILVPTDGSEVADLALEHAITVADPHGAAVHLLYVVDMRLARAAPNLARDELRDALSEEGRTVTASLERRVRDADLPATATVREGVPADEIIDYASEVDADLVVMGTHGKSQRERLLAGSVTDRVGHRADVPVMTVPGLE